MANFKVKVKNQIKNAPVDRLLSIYPEKPVSNPFLRIPKNETIIKKSSYKRSFKMREDGSLRLSVTSSPGVVTRQVKIEITAENRSSFNIELMLPEGITPFSKRYEDKLIIIIPPGYPHWLLKVKPRDVNPLKKFKNIPTCSLILRDANEKPDAVTPGNEGPGPLLLNIIN